MWFHNTTRRDIANTDKVLRLKDSSMRKTMRLNLEYHLLFNVVVDLQVRKLYIF